VAIPCISFLVAAGPVRLPSDSVESRFSSPFWAQQTFFALSPSGPLKLSYNLSHSLADRSPFSLICSYSSFVFLEWLLSFLFCVLFFFFPPVQHVLSHVVVRVFSGMLSGASRRRSPPDFPILLPALKQVSFPAEARRRGAPLYLPVLPRGLLAVFSRKLWLSFFCSRHGSSCLPDGEPALRCPFALGLTQRVSFPSPCCPLSFLSLRLGSWASAASACRVQQNIPPGPHSSPVPLAFLIHMRS